MSLPLIVSGSPGFQSLTSFASPGSGRNQFIPAGGEAELVRNITNTRPVKGVSSADLVEGEPELERLRVGRGRLGDENEQEGNGETEAMHGAALRCDGRRQPNRF